MYEREKIWPEDSLQRLEKKIKINLYKFA